MLEKRTYPCRFHWCNPPMIQGADTDSMRFKRSCPSALNSMRTATALAKVRVAFVVVPLLTGLLAAGQQLEPGREHIAGVDTFTAQIKTKAGYEVRAFITKPKGMAGKLPLLFVVGWLSCDSVEAPVGPMEGFTQLLFDLAQKSGFATFRINKPGLDGSGGPACEDTDFNAELAAYQHAFDSLAEIEFLDPSRVYVVGFSNGGGIAPLVPRGKPVLGYLVFSGWYKTWFEHMLEAERRRLQLSGAAPGAINSSLRKFATFYDLYLNSGKTPGQVLALHPELSGIWTEGPDHQYGRPAAFYQQLQMLNLGEAWEAIRCPTLAIHGEFDSIMSKDDYELLVESLNRKQPGSAQFVNWPDLDHALIRQKSTHSGQGYDPKLTDFVLAWLRKQTTSKTSGDRRTSRSRIG